MSNYTRKRVEYWTGVFWALAFTVTVIWLAFQPNDTPQLKMYHTPEYTLEQFTE